MKHLHGWLAKNAWIKTLVLGFMAWRVGLFVIGAIAPWFFIYAPSFPYSDVIFTPYNLPPWLYSWANFDGVHYLTIIERGYLAVNYIQAFFPMYPLKVIVMNGVWDSSLINGLLVSNVSAIGVFVAWFYLLKEQGNVKKAWVGTAILALFPTSFFLGAFYNESLFLLQVLLAFIAARKKYWLLAGILVAAATATRVVGIFMVPALAVEWLLQYREQHKAWPTPSLQLIKQNWPVGVAWLLGCTGLLAYMAYLAVNFNDPLYFFHVQSEFGAGRQETLVTYPQVVVRYLKILATARPIDWRYLTYIQEFAAGVGGLGLLIAAYFKKVRLSYLVFALAAFLLPTLTGTFSSMGRYLLVCFPIFMVLTEYLHNRPKLMVGYLVLSSLLLVINVMLFIQGYWVA